MTDPTLAASEPPPKSGPQILAGLRLWALTSRPKTLVAAIAPVMLGCAAAWQANGFQALPASLCLAFALLIQIGTNWANDYYDFLHGADTPERIGPTRSVAAGLIAPKTLQRATIAIFLIAFIVGCGLLPYLGWLGLILGVLCILCGIAYTGGPFPLAYHGLGDIFVFIFFGLVAVNATFAVQTAYFTLDVLLISLVPGALATQLLVVNNDRDQATDARAGKKTLAVRFGRRFSQIEYAALSLISIAVPLILWIRGWQAWVGLPCLLIPLMYQLYRRFTRADSAEAFQGILTGTARLLILYSTLLAIGMVLG